ncbi:Uncharacterized protein APZ42_010860 [Daphnia magna]|uniref:Uncharacterized protein n=1 Tax=Daphnia magna TaxID=35525 RepID=A0A162T901_9CRUS|nr:Uncharacterized protein APZ42_010860 [Daphnia magna]
MQLFKFLECMELQIMMLTMCWQMRTCDKVSRNFQTGPQFLRFLLVENLLVVVIFCYRCTRTVN